jgi:hypothetical protein
LSVPRDLFPIFLLKSPCSLSPYLSLPAYLMRKTIGERKNIFHFPVFSSQLIRGSVELGTGNLEPETCILHA